MKIWKTLLILALLFTAAAQAQAICLEDQYGDQYTLTLDNKNGLLAGTAVTPSAFGCTTPSYHALGSFWRVDGQILYEITVFSPLGDGETMCSSGWKIFGAYPNGEWAYFDSGYGAQPFTWKKCGAPLKAYSPAAPLPGLGPLR